MKLKVKDMDIATGSTLVALLHEDDARNLDLYPEDRIKIRKGKKEVVAVIDIAESKKAVPRGKIGLFEETLKALNAKNNDVVEIFIEPKPESTAYIKKKLDGKELNKNEIYSIISDIVKNNLSISELTFFVSACYTNKLSIEETVNLTRAIVETGTRLDIKDKLILDKHCTGGVPGNRTTMLIVPIIASLGYIIPKTSSRAITSAAGTADTMEVLANVNFDVKKLKRIIEKVNACIAWGGALELASADDKLIKVRNPLSLDPEGMLIASILAKKAAVNATHVLIDIPIGPDAKIKTRQHALSLKEEFINIGKKLGMKIHVEITDGKQPIGNGIGPALEARDVLWVLKRDPRRPLDLEKKAVILATKLLELAGIKNADKKVIQALEEGLAYKKMREIIRFQGGNPNINPDDIKVGKYYYDLKADKDGTIADLNNFAINRIARIAGAPKDKGAGIYLYKHEGNHVFKGEKILRIYSESEEKLKFALKDLKSWQIVKIT